MGGMAGSINPLSWPTWPLKSGLICSIGLVDHATGYGTNISKMSVWCRQNNSHKGKERKDALLCHGF